MTTFIYIRVSTREQSDNGLSLPAQVRECRRYCELRDIPLHPSATNVGDPGVFADPGVSAWKCPLLQRPGFKELWNHIQPGDQIVFSAFDRAFRSVQDFLKTWEILKAKQVVPIFVRDGIQMDTANNQLWAVVVAAFAEFQSQLISERVKEANAVRKLRQQGAGESSTATRAPHVRPRIESPEQSIQRTISADESILQISQAKEQEREARKSAGRVFGYARVSTLDQDVTLQHTRLERTIQQLVEERGYTSAGIFTDDGVSAFKIPFRDRPGGSEIWRQLQPGDAVVVTRLDRMFRSAVDIANTLKYFESREIVLCGGGLDTGSFLGRSQANMLGVMGELESRVTSHRTKLAMRMLQRKIGPWVSGKYPRWVNTTVTRGHTHIHVNRRMVQDIMEMVTLYDAGWTAAEISDHMQAQHEKEFNLPVKVPRSGIQTRHMMEQRLRVKKQWQELAQFKSYCDFHGIKHHEMIDRHYSMLDAEVYEFLRTATRGSLKYWLKNHGEALLRAVPSTDC